MGCENPPSPRNPPPAAKILQASKWLRNSRSTLRIRLQTAMTSSFQLQIAYHLKHWTPEFLRFETRYSMHNLSSRKCSKMCPTVAKWGCGYDISAHGLRSHLQTAITSLFQLQIEHRLKVWTPDFLIFKTTYAMHEMDFSKYF